MSKFSWVDPVARIGYVAKGIIYSISGLLAVQFALGSGGTATGRRGALRAIGDEPFGRMMLGAMAVGLLAYAICRFVQAVFDPEVHSESSGKRVVKRVVRGISGAGYIALAYFAARAAWTGRDDHARSYEGGTLEAMTSALLGTGLGPWFLGLIGVLVIAIGGVYQARRSWNATFMSKFEENVARDHRGVLTGLLVLGRIGIATRAITFAIMGYLIIRLAWSEAGRGAGLSDALDYLYARSFGDVSLGVVAVGLICYGLYCLGRAGLGDMPDDDVPVGRRRAEF